ncbi:NAD(P)H-quinone oxidoreductase [Corynebacterium sp. 320]|uniref:NAD(P)H-quinone oxidoreductase n=1 Tax=Corynebacterium TaxID=1716 RepID=UPI00125CB78A|nr:MULTISPECIES: NAD(P)H-quinone oxidoreductase [Corynebacterium]KAB1502742.1 NAD(P)H-quinone oxidoreductase [Corynebacterium sp. 320]KAB1550520.1 NAD(P)H-quinone oxidoreductase [Corynebacterium sp. 319]KAB1554752.1 NAD(P)H-quinone oxidoreductase [Corynebacterium sp. 321]KAB3526405.1 NAD(P)H-quinone oxidoreductase [Corynebacterium sp. 250]KAB3537748.1 NAD(P)H-quinone oxidoreductase [Corynebacterium sp. 366]
MTHDNASHNNTSPTTNNTSHAIVQTETNDPSSLTWQPVTKPTPKDGEALVAIHFAGVNRADTLQAAGHYPPPQGTTNTIGLEAAGVVEDPNGAQRPDGSPWQAGDQVAVLLSGGGYAQHVTVPHGQLMPLPEGYSLRDAASVVEVATTVWSNIMMTAHVNKGDLVLFHGGGGGIGLFGIQTAKALGARVAVTAGSQNKLDTCARYGADILINYKEEDFAEVLTAEGGANVILDIIGAKYLDSNIKALAPDGHIVTIGMQGGVKGELNIGRLLATRGTISATGLRYRDPEDKARIVRATYENVWPLLADGTIRTHVDRVLPVQQAAEAHKALLAGEVTGKIVLEVPQV